MAPKEANNKMGRDDLSQEKKKACHQCRQKTDNFGGACKKNKNKRPCPIRYCARCLLNRYGDQEKVAQMEDRWICPKCRNICNYSCCRKKMGEMPTGMLIHVAKASGFASVHDLLQKLQGVPNGPNNFQHQGADLIALLPSIPKKKRTTKKRRANSYKANKYIAERPPWPTADDNVIPSGSQATSNTDAQAGEEGPTKAPATFRLFGVTISIP